MMVLTSSSYNLGINIIADSELVPNYIINKLKEFFCYYLINTIIIFIIFNFFNAIQFRF